MAAEPRVVRSGCGRRLVLRRTAPVGALPRAPTLGGRHSRCQTRPRVARCPRRPFVPGRGGLRRVATFRPSQAGCRAGSRRSTRWWRPDRAGGRRHHGVSHPPRDTKAFRLKDAGYFHRVVKDECPGTIREISTADSARNVMIQLADMVAGAIHRSYSSTKPDAKLYRAVLQRRLRDARSSIWEFR
ncbi:DUF3800 domain-containing protein [Cnuibacter sp. UC19_7]|uniref:DUF3800 domain-containing protein n=1 Tax=Cnuibacter sp. UC19_7 TaxID=3350166 RepID=UPI00366F68FD